ncbi:MAG: hypothetical protein OJF59_002352 [Cytophagales bacterium]|nr:MAG: hypothetical protein OJF59_002352 [Cytophagales bacterium]
MIFCKANGMDVKRNPFSDEGESLTKFLTTGMVVLAAQS